MKRWLILPFATAAGLAGCGDGPPRGPATNQVQVTDTNQVPPPTTPGDSFLTWSLPPWAAELLQQGSYLERYELFTELNPYYLRGHFDQDEEIDLAVQVREARSGKRGVAMLHRASGTVYVLGAGESFGNGGDDFSWLEVWRVEPRETLSDPELRGRELLLVLKPESAGGLIWWNGTNYVWTQWGD